MSDSVRPHRQQPTKLLRPWDSPGKNTGVGCHFLLQCRKLKSESEVAQLCPTLGDPIGGSPPDSPVPGILQARTLEWVAISFSNAWKWKVKVKSLSRVQLLVTPWTAAYQAPPSMGFSRQEYWSVVPLPSPEAHIKPKIFTMWHVTGKVCQLLLYKVSIIRRLSKGTAAICPVNHFPPLDCLFPATPSMGPKAYSRQIALKKGCWPDLHLSLAVVSTWSSVLSRSWNLKAAPACVYWSCWLRRAVQSWSWATSCRPWSTPRSFSFSAPQVGLPREHVLQEVKEANSEGSVSFDQMNCVKYCWNMYTYGASFIPLGWD